MQQSASSISGDSTARMCDGFRNERMTNERTEMSLKCDLYVHGERGRCRAIMNDHVTIFFDRENK